MQKRKIIFHVFLFSALVIGTPFFYGCGPSGSTGNCCGQKVEADKIADENMSAAVSMAFKNDAIVTFIELGSMNCVPCRMMQPVIDNIENKFGSRVNVIFHDVMKPGGRPYAAKYGIRSIPTQIFLDRDGKEFFRHVGFFPEKEIIKILSRKGLNL